MPWEQLQERQREEYLAAMSHALSDSLFRAAVSEEFKRIWEAVVEPGPIVPKGK